jgi:8-oxo-dGTP pyrophosphatase MutT (NUDIX family)
MGVEGQYGLPFPEDPVPIEVTWVMLIRYEKDIHKLSFLVAERVSGGQLTFPGGKIEPGETAQHAAEREVRQEIGLQFRSREDLLEQVQPQLFHSGGVLYRANPFFVFYEEGDGAFTRPQLKEPDKHKAWEWISLPQLIRAIIQGKVPSFVLNDKWMDIVTDTLFLDTLPDGYEEEPPAWFLEECSAIRYEELLRKFREKVLR